MRFKDSQLPLTDLCCFVKKVYRFSPKIILLNEGLHLIQALKRYDYATFQHSVKVAWLSTALAKRLELSQMDIFEVCIGSLFHDIGKTKIPPFVLNKAGKLSKTEWELVKGHPMEGVSILLPYVSSVELLRIIAYHHERIDGHGYLGLNGETIPLKAKIVSLCDAFEAMTSPRLYRSTFTISQSLVELETNSGNQFEKTLIAPFTTLLYSLEFKGGFSIAW